MLPARRNNQNWMPDIFNDFFDNTWMERPKATCPAINVLETPEAYRLELAAPGMTKADFNIHLDEDGDLVINMEKRFSLKFNINSKIVHRPQIQVNNNKMIYLGAYDDIMDAVNARVEAENIYYKEFSYNNSINNYE